MRTVHTFKEYRKKRYLSQRCMAEELGLYTTTWARLERGEAFPSNDTIVYLAKHMQVSRPHIVRMAEKTTQSLVGET